jgi:hypothetical protein
VSDDVIQFYYIAQLFATTCIKSKHRRQTGHLPDRTGSPLKHIIVQHHDRLAGSGRGFPVLQPDAGAEDLLHAIFKSELFKHFLALY